MATYTVYVPSNLGDTRQRADRTIFVREAFNWPAFVFGPLYLLYRRLWVATFGWLAIAAALGFLAHAVELSPFGRIVVFLMLALLTGFEASVLRQSGLRRGGYVFAALLTTSTLEQAERAFFNGEGLRESGLRAPSERRPSPEARALRPPEVIGLFPRAGEA